MVKNNIILVFCSFFPNLKNAHMLNKAHYYYFFFFHPYFEKDQVSKMNLSHGA